METSGRIWPNFELIQALIHVLITCKYQKGSNQKKRRKCDDIIFPIISIWDFFIRSRAANSAVLGPIWPNFELVRDVMDVTCKYDVSSMTNLRRPVRLQNVFLTFRKQNNTLNGHVLITCYRRFQNVKKTFYRRTGRLWFVTLSVWGVASVFQTSRRRYEDVLDVSNL